jgi:phytoene dehydrogenase-like protein
MTEYDAIVIGAGNGGLTSACTMAQNGLKTLLLEQHNVPGGYATSFCRGRFEFEVALHQLSGLGSPQKPGPLRKALDEMDVTNMLEWVDMGKLYKVVIPGHLELTLPANREGSINALKEKFPGDSDKIEAFFKLVYQCWNEFSAMYQYNYDSVDVESRLDPAASPEKYPVFFKYAFQTLQKVLDEWFQNPLLKTVVSIYSSYSGHPKEIAFLDLVIWIFYYIEYGAYHIKGGSQALSNAIVKRFLESGGDVRFNCGVNKILVENGSATGVITESGEVIKARQIVSNASPLTVYTEMIDRANLPKGQLEVLNGSRISASTFLIYIALDCHYSQIGFDETTYFLFTPAVGNYFSFSCYNVSNPDCSPPGTTMLTCVALQTDRRWLALPPEQYFEKKYEYAEKLLQQMEQSFPGLREHIEEIEVATPLTNIRYSRAPGGAIGGFIRTSKDFYLFPMDRPLIKGLDFVGAASTISGGYHPTLIHGRAVGLDIADKLKKSGRKIRGRETNG